MQEVAVARRALRVQLEILDAAVLQDDDLDVLAADVADHVDVVVEMQAGFGVGHGFDERGIGADHVLQNVFGVAGGAHAQYLERRRPDRNLPFKLVHHLDGVLDRVALRKLISLGQDAALCVLREQHGLGGSRAAVDADEAFHHFARLKGCGHEFLGAVLVLERARSSCVLRQSAGAAALGFFFFAAHGDVPLELVEAGVLADAASSVLPNSTEPMAAKYCALSGVRIRSSGGTPSGSGVPRSSQIFGMLASSNPACP